VDRSLTVAATVARCHSNHARQYWKVSINAAINSDYIFIGLLANGSEYIKRYYLLPTGRFPEGLAVYISENAPAFEIYHVPDIISLYPTLIARETEDR
jgi:hypothetical protein